MVFEKVKEIIVDTISCDEDQVKLEANLKEDLGIDSLDATELSMALEEEYGISKSVQASLRMKKRQTEDEFPLPFSKTGKRILYKRELIEAWLLKKAV